MNKKAEARERFKAMIAKKQEKGGKKGLVKCKCKKGDKDCKCTKNGGKCKCPGMGK